MVLSAFRLPTPQLMIALQKHFAVSLQRLNQQDRKPYPFPRPHRRVDRHRLTSAARATAGVTREKRWPRSTSQDGDLDRKVQDHWLTCTRFDVPQSHDVRAMCGLAMWASLRQNTPRLIYNPGVTH
jgi:hypothetical protein